ncbi:hypothetical protein SHKM778_03810 [Streptomyces sp. KM77-8]|uniref:Bacterial type II secretion system protein E domain-containing protein n=1 Tax=Streptomyces haneummycinicus TaxID=3074435 RepID=A0AAT9H9C7_9ACTN
MRQALRMRPDRLVVGEVRGPEVVHLLAALNTGHDGSGTVHANAATDVPARLEALGTAAGLDRYALHSQLAAAVSVVLHLVRDRSGQRRIAEVHVLERDPSGLVLTVPALRWGPGAFTKERGWQQLRELLRNANADGPGEGPGGDRGDRGVDGHCRGLPGDRGLAAGRWARRRPAGQAAAGRR